MSLSHISKSLMRSNLVTATVFVLQQEKYRLDQNLDLPDLAQKYPLIFSSPSLAMILFSSRPVRSIL